MRRSDQLRERWERREQQKKQAAEGAAAINERPAESASKAWPCGMCPSCLQRDACAGDYAAEKTCGNYLAPEPTRYEWPEIYRAALRKAEEPCDVTAQIHRIGRVNGLRSAMMQIHGFTIEEMAEIEGSI